MNKAKQLYSDTFCVLGFVCCFRWKSIWKEGGKGGEGGKREIKGGESDWREGRKEGRQKEERGKREGRRERRNPQVKQKKLSL